MSFSIKALASTLAYCPKWIIRSPAITDSTDTLYRYLFDSPRFARESSRPIKLSIYRVGDLIQHHRTVANDLTHLFQETLFPLQSKNRDISLCLEEFEELKAKVTTLEELESFEDFQAEVIDPIEELHGEMMAFLDKLNLLTLLDKSSESPILPDLEERVSAITSDLNNPPPKGEKGNHPLQNILLISEIEEEEPTINPPILTGEIIQVLKALKKSEFLPFKIEEEGIREIEEQYLKLSSEKSPMLLALLDAPLRSTVEPVWIDKIGDVALSKQFGPYGSHLIRYRRQLEGGHE